MSLRQKLRQIYNEHEVESMEKLTTNLKQRKKESKEWVEKVLTPYLLENASEGLIQIRDDILSVENMHDPMYRIAIEKTGVTIVTYGRNYIGLSWV